MPLAVAALVAGSLLPAAPASAAPVATIDLDRYTTASGTFLPIIHVSINGSDPIPMLMDTGSNIVVTFPGAIQNATTPVTDTGVAHTASYVGTSTSGTIGLGTVSIATQGGGSIATPSTVAFLDGTVCTPDCLGDGIGAGLGGIFGVSQEAVSAGGYHLYSALAQLGGTAAVGYTVNLTATGGTLELGAPDIPGAVVVQQPSGSGTYPNGFPHYDKHIPLCLQIHTAEECAPTVVDTGELASFFMGAQFLPWANAIPPVVIPGVGYTHVGNMIPGTPVGFAAASGGQPFAQWGIDSAPFGASLFEPASGGSSSFNTGNQFFLGRAIGFDVENGRVLIGPIRDAPDPVSGLVVTASEGAIAVSWTASPDPTAGYLVTLRGADGSRNAARVSGLSTSFTGLAPATSFSVQVVPLTPATGSPAGAAVGASATTPAVLPPTGRVAEPLLPIGLLLLAAGVLMVVAGARFDRGSRPRGSLSRLGA